MAHNINRTNGRDAFAFTGDRKSIWHGLGQEIRPDALWTEVHKAAGLDWQVVKVPAYTRRPDGLFAVIPDHYATIRSDTHDALGVVGDRYEPVQNAEAFQWLDAFHGLRYSTAGALGRGERVFIVAEFPDLDFSVRGEQVRNYLLFTSTHDGSGSVEGGFTPTRVVCQNTLNLALGTGLDRHFRVRHTASWKDGLKQAERIIGLNRTYCEGLAQVAESLAAQRLTREQAEGLYTVLVPDPEDAKPTRAQNVRAELLTLFESGHGNRGESRWDWLNGAVEYADHARTIRGANKAESRFTSSMFGSAQAFKQRAFDLAVAAY